MKRTFTKHVFMRASVMLLMTMLTSIGAWAGTLTHFPIYEGDEGTEAKPYQIKSATDLDYLAEDVNSGTTYEDCYFKVTAPITYTSSDAWNLESSEANNFTAIGNWNKPFKGIFDGNHQTISGIRIYKGGTNFTNDCALGIFGCIEGSAVVKDVTLKNTRITGYNEVAGIVGAIPEGTTATISGCIVGENVAIHTAAIDYNSIYNYSHGGIVGFFGSGTVSGCFSAATLTVVSEVSSSSQYNSHGAIVGRSIQGTLSNNYYSGSVNGVFTGVGKGTTNSTTTSDVTENNGALPVHTFTLTNSTTTSATTSAAKILTYDGKDYYRDGTTVTITVTVPSGNVLNSLTVTDGSSNTVAERFWYSNNTVSFALPANNVIVSAPTFTSDLTSLYINMPKTGTVNATIPSGVQSFKVYDDGGSTASYSKLCNGTLILTAPDNKILKISGAVDVSWRWHQLKVWDGEEDTDNQIVAANSNFVPAYTTGNKMRLGFQTDSQDPGGHFGLDLDITVLNPNETHSVTVANVSNGHFETVDPAKVNDVVTLTAVPDAGYVLSEIQVTDEYGTINVNWDTFSNTATFKMRDKDVTVTPTFSNSPSVNMPASGATKNVTFPNGFTSIKVYDEGGPSAYQPGSQYYGYLTITAPTGYVLQLSGQVGTGQNSNNYLNVYDGTDNSASLLIDKFKGYSLTTPYTVAVPTVVSSGQSITIYSSIFSNSWYTNIDLTVTLVKEVELVDNTDNTTVIDDNDGLTSTVTLSGRTLYCDGDWNTLCLPFAVSNFTGTPLEGATVKELLPTSNLDNTGKLTLNFSDDLTAIEAGKPYIVKWTPNLTISSASDWDAFATAVSGGTTYEGQIVKLAANISVSTMVGAVSGTEQQKAFQGTFDGGGHTITVSISNTSDQGTAPFRFIKNATIKNVKTTGTVTGGMHCAGLVGFAQGTNTIQNCHVDVAVTGSGSNHSHLGGVLGHGLSSKTTITDCLFSGSISNAGTATGIIYGWADNGTHTIVNCLAAGTYTSCNDIDMMKGSDTQTATNCYKNVSDGSKGTQTDATGDALVALLGAGWVNNSGNVVPKMNPNIVNPRFGGVTIVKTAPTAVSFTNNASTGDCQFVGNYSPFTIDDSNIKSVILLGSNNKLGYSSTNPRTLRCFRAHFFVPSKPDGGSSVRNFELNFGEDGGTTGVFQIENGELKVKTLNSGWYTLGGLKLQGEPTEKGVYIYNGKKVVLK